MKRSSFITWDQLRVGLVILAALGILTLAVYKLGQAANLFTKRYTLVAFLKEANGLRQGGTVTLAGQLAGTVKAIEFLTPDNDTTRNLRIIIGVDQNLQQQIRADSKAQIRTMGLLGDKIFDITPGTPRYNVLNSGDTIAVSPALDYEQVLSQAAGAVGDV
jgi:phospholipid/cholesterol/gamma-HCH transport system substrate-binding protein